MRVNNFVTMVGMDLATNADSCLIFDRNERAKKHS